MEGKAEFLKEMYEIYDIVESLVEKYGMEDHVLFALFVGVMEESEEGVKVDAACSVTVNDQLELDIISSSFQETFDKGNLDDLLSGTGISLN